MKKIIYSLLIVSLAIFSSCKDDSLDPLNFSKVKKGTMLALRGTQLDNIYNLGLPGAEFFPRIITGTEKFEFDAEFLSEDPQSLESFDIYVIKRTKVGNTVTLDRILFGNVPFSEFVDDGTYRNPWVSVSMDLVDILDLLGLDYTNPTDVDIMLDTYAFGVAIEIDLNLKGGGQVLAADIVAQGLFQSDQFYPAQKLTYTVTDYCTYDADIWAGDFDATETSEFFGGYGPYTVTLVQDGVDPNKYTTDNWYDSGIPIYMVFTPSTGVDTQIITVPTQPNPNNPARSISGVGTYNQCKEEISMTFEYKQGTAVLDRFIWKLVRP